MKHADHLREYLTDVLGYDADILDEIQDHSGVAGLKLEVLDWDEFKAFTKG